MAEPELDAEVRALRERLTKLEESQRKAEQEQLRTKELVEDILFVHASSIHCPRCLELKRRYVKGDLIKKYVFKRSVGELYRCPECQLEFARTVHRAE